MKKKNSVLISNKIEKFNKTISVEGDKSISHRSLLIASQCMGPSNLKGVLESEDVKNTIACLKKLGVRVKWNKKNNSCEIYGNGLNSYVYKKNLILDAGNSGTTARLLSVSYTHLTLPTKA